MIVCSEKICSYNNMILFLTVIGVIPCMQIGIQTYSFKALNNCFLVYSK